MPNARANTVKWSGSSAAGLKVYLEDDEKALDDSEKAARYLDMDNGDVLFPHAGGKLLEDFGIELSRGLTKQQFDDLFHGRWEGQQLVAPGYVKQYVRDKYGREVYRENPETGKREPIPVMVQDTTRTGNPRFDADGNPIMKHAHERVHTPGIDLTVSFDKGVSQLVIAYPHLKEQIEQCMVDAGREMMRVAVEENPFLLLARETVKPPSQDTGRTTKMEGSATQRVRVDDLAYFMVPQWGSRPTPESDARLGGTGVVDSHGHLHVFLFNIAKLGDKTCAIDTSVLFKNGNPLFRAEVAHNALTRLLEDRLGIKMKYDQDIKGDVHSEIKGHNEEAKEFLSTNSKRRLETLRAFEQKHGRTPKPWEHDREMQKTKGRKSTAAKEADKGGVAYFERVRMALEEVGITLDIPEPSGQPVERSDAYTRLQTLYERVEQGNGLVRDVERDESGAETPVFGPEVIYPTFYRCAVGLGFEADTIRSIADHYRDFKLVVMRDAKDANNKLYTVPCLPKMERAIDEDLTRSAGKQGRAVSDTTAELFRHEEGKFELDEDQDQAYDAINSGAHLVSYAGEAGAGKTAPAKRAVSAMRHDGTVRRVVSVSRQSKRAVDFGKDINADIMGSIEHLTGKVKEGLRLTSDDIVFIDEAGLLSTYDMTDLLESIGPARRVLIGDLEQGVAIGAAGWLQQEWEKRPPVMLKHTYRQKDPEDLAAIRLIRSGHGHAALANLDERGRLFTAETPELLTSQIADRYKHYRDQGHAYGEVGITHQGSNTDLDSLIRFVTYDAIQRGDINGEQWREVEHPDNGRRWRLYEGEQIIFTEGWYDGVREPVRNGQTATILKFRGDKEVRIQLHDSERRVLTLPISHSMVDAIVQNTMKRQGDEVPVNLVNPGNPGIATKNSAYTQTSRTSELMEVFADRETWGENPWQNVGRVWSQRHTKHLVSNYIKETDQVDLTWDLEMGSDGYAYAVRVEVPVEEELVTTAASAADQLQNLRAALDQKIPEQGMGRGLGLGL